MSAGRSNDSQGAVPAVRPPLGAVAAVEGGVLLLAALLSVPPERDGLGAVEMRTSSISWTDYSSNDLNFITGCTPVSAGCQNCYARAIYERFGKDHSKVEIHPDKLARLATMRFHEHSPKRGAPHTPLAFVVDTGDLFHEDVPASVIVAALEVMASRTDVIWQVLTKRPERFQPVLYGAEGGWYLGGNDYWPNIHLGVTVENQAMADERIPLLLDTPAAVHWISVEPMLGPVDMRQVVMQDGDHLGPTMHNWGCDTGLDWVVCGGESGPNRRPFDVAWALNLYEQCAAARVPYWYKQGSALKPGQAAVLPGYGVVQEWPEEGA